MGTWGYLKPPSWMKSAVISPQGWRHPRTRELLASCYGNLIEQRRHKLDGLESQILMENGSFFVMESPNADGSVNYMLLE